MIEEGGFFPGESEAAQLRKRQAFLRAKLVFIENKPLWFHRRMLEDTGLAPADVAELEESSGALLTAAQLDAVEKFLTRFQSGAITEVAHEIVLAEESPFLGEQDRAAVAAPRVAGPAPSSHHATESISAARKVVKERIASSPPPQPPAPRRDPPLTTAPRRPDPMPTPISTDEKKARKERCKAAWARYDNLEKPHGFAGKFLKVAGLSYGDLVKFDNGTATFEKLAVFESGLKLAESGQILTPEKGRKAKNKAAPRPSKKTVGTRCVASENELPEQLPPPEDAADHPVTFEEISEAVSRASLAKIHADSLIRRYAEQTAA